MAGRTEALHPGFQIHPILTDPRWKRSNNSNP